VHILRHLGAHIDSISITSEPGCAHSGIDGFLVPGDHCRLALSGSTVHNDLVIIVGGRVYPCRPL